TAASGRPELSCSVPLSLSGAGPCTRRPDHVGIPVPRPFPPSLLRCYGEADCAPRSGVPVRPKPAARSPKPEATWFFLCMIASGAFMKSVLAVLLGVMLVGSGSFVAQSTEPVDTAAVERIRDEGFNRSQLRDTMFWLTDRYG